MFLHGWISNIKNKFHKISFNGALLEINQFNLAVSQGQATLIWPKLEKRLITFRKWWKQWQDAPLSDNKKRLILVIVAALDAAVEVNAQLGRWHQCLALLREMELILKTHSDSLPAFILARWKSYYPLAKLGKLQEAQQVLVECLQVYHQLNDWKGQTRTLFALSELGYENHNLPQAIALTRQALPLLKQVNDLHYAAHFHGNLRFYLTKAGQPAEASKHALAQLVYHLISRNWQEVKSDLQNLRGIIQETNENMLTYPLPQLTDLLNQPEFYVLTTFLQDYKVHLETVQTVIDEGLKAVMSGTR